MGFKRVRIDLDKDTLVKLRDEGKTVAEIALYFGVTKKIVTNNIKRYGIQKGTKKNINVNLLKQYLNEGLPITEICKRFNVDKCVINRYLKELNIKRSKEEINQNRKQTILQMCNGSLEDYYSKISAKQYKTWQKKTGLDDPYKDPDMIERRKQTCIEKYGCENAMQSEIVKNKAIMTNIERYGCKAPFQNEGIREKAKQNYFNKTGYYNPSQNPEVRNKKVKTFEEKYGVPNSSQQNFSEKAKQILFNRESFISYIKNNNIVSVGDIVEDLSVSKSTIWKTIRRLNIKEYIPKFISHGEEELKRYVLSIGVDCIKTNNIFNDKRELDIYCPDYNIALEYNGVYYHSDIFHERLYHYNKSKDCEALGIRLIHIYEDEWNDPVKKEIIKSLIKVAFGKVDTKIYARQCEIREITNKEAKPFNNKNHIQGHRNAQITYGLYYNNELVQLMSFSWNTHYQAWEIIRGCPGSNNIVVGGVSKLFKHFIKEKKPEKIFSYCDFNKFNGVGYEAIGMKFIGDTKYNKWYVINGKRFERNPSKYKEYNEMKECIIYGAGSKKYLWENPLFNPNDNK